MTAQIHSQFGTFEIVHAMGGRDYVFVRDDSGAAINATNIRTPQTNHPRVFVWFCCCAAYNAIATTTNPAHCENIEKKIKKIKHTNEFTASIDADAVEVKYRATQNTHNVSFHFLMVRNCVLLFFNDGYGVCG